MGRRETAIPAAGRMMCLKLPAPEAGRSRSFTAKIMISMMSSQKRGMACPSTASTDAVWSWIRFLRMAARTPRGMEMMRASNSPDAASQRVMGMRSRTRLRAGLWATKDFPKSPRIMPERNLKYCKTRGRSSPISRRRSSTSSFVASGGRRISTGSRNKWRSEKVIRLIPQMTMTAWNSR